MIIRDTADSKFAEFLASHFRANGLNVRKLPGEAFLKDPDAKRGAFFVLVASEASAAKLYFRRACSLVDEMRTLRGLRGRIAVARLGSDGALRAASNGWWGRSLITTHTNVGGYAYVIGFQAEMEIRAEMEVVDRTARAALLYRIRPSAFADTHDQSMGALNEAMNCGPEESGRRMEAYLSALEADPACVWAYYGLAQVTRYGQGTYGKDPYGGISRYGGPLLELVQSVFPKLTHYAFRRLRAFSALAGVDLDMPVRGRTDAYSGARPWHYLTIVHKADDAFRKSLAAMAVNFIPRPPRGSCVPGPLCSHPSPVG